MVKSISDFYTKLEILNIQITNIITTNSKKRNYHLKLQINFKLKNKKKIFF